MKFELLGIQFIIGRPRKRGTDTRHPTPDTRFVGVDDPSLPQMTHEAYALSVPIIERDRDGKITHDPRGVYEQVLRCPGLRKSRVFCSTPEVMN